VLHQALAGRFAIELPARMKVDLRQGSGSFRRVNGVAAAGVVQAMVMCWLRVPPGHERAELQGLFERMSESILTQVTGRDRSLLGGVVTADDADAASLFDMARNILGNPYDAGAGSGDDRPDDDRPEDVRPEDDRFDDGRGTGDAGAGESGPDGAGPVTG